MKQTTIQKTDDTATDVKSDLQLPTRAETLGESIIGLFEVSENKLASLGTFLLGLAVVTWFIDSWYPLIDAIGIRLAAWWLETAYEPVDLASLAIRTLPPTIIAAALLIYLYNKKRNEIKYRNYESKVPHTHPGLILMLSPYRPLFGKAGYASAHDLSYAIRANSLDREMLFKGCNWGQLAFVIKYHAAVLKHVWVLVTNGEGGSEGELDDFKELVDVFCNDVEIHSVTITNKNEIDGTAAAVSSIYLQLSESNSTLNPEEVICDFTGGTSAMSAGMILATVNENEELEYVAQGYPLSDDLTNADIARDKIILSHKTDQRMVGYYSRRRPRIRNPFAAGRSKR
jgi:hypothetical protein